MSKVTTSAVTNRVAAPRRRTWRPGAALVALGVLAWLAGMLAGDSSGASTAAEHGGSAERLALLIEVDGAIGPAMGHYITSSISEAEQRGAAILIIRLDTPGGLDSTTREIVRAIIGADVPVAIYVAPSGARAASAGTYMLYASHVAAMAPGTNLGAATPIQMGGMPGGGATEPPADDPPEGGSPDDADIPAEQPPQPATAAERKMIEDAVAYLQGLAELRGRNAQWAEQAVREAASLAYHSALEQNVIEIVADDVDDLLEQAHGMEVLVGREMVPLDTAGATVEIIEAGWRTELLAALTNPNVVFLLMMIGFYGLLLEFSNPGAVYPGVIGAVSLILALFGLNLLPLNYAGLALVLLGIAFMVGEAFTPSFGALGLGGVIAFILGSVILFDTDVAEFRLAWPTIVVLAAVSVGVFVFLVGTLWKSQHRPVVAGREELAGASAQVIAWDSTEQAGWVRLHGEQWRATSEHRIRPNTWVRVVAADGLTLHVEPAGDAADEAQATAGDVDGRGSNTEKRKGEES